MIIYQHALRSRRWQEEKSEERGQQEETNL